MKHNLKITLLLLSLFLIANLIGLYVVDKFITKLPYNIERPEVNKEVSFLPIFVSILVVTIVFLLLIRFKAKLLWRLWFFLSILFTLSVSLSAFINQTLAFFVALILAFFKVIYRNLYVHNLTELFIYGGLAAIFVPLFNLVSISILLILISIYDFIAVFKTKHMIKLFKYQAEEVKVFAGFYIPYSKKKQAILGGGDIGFPLLFAGVVLNNYNLISALFVVLFASVALLSLMLIGKEKKFYPAMPFLTAGCFFGYL